MTVTLILAGPLNAAQATKLLAATIKDYNVGDAIVLPTADAAMQIINAGFAAGVDPHNPVQVAAALNGTLGMTPAPDPPHVTYGGSGAPIILERDGDLYLRTNGELYQQAASAWVLLTTFGAGGGAGVPATTVTSATAFGAAAAVGTGTPYARSDHGHGTPALGTTGATAAAGNDTRLSDARTPTVHAASHATGGSDPVTPAAIGATPTSRQVISGTGLTGGGALTADRTLVVAYGTAAGTAAQGNDTRLSDARTPTVHASTHASGGSDPVTPAAIGADPSGAATSAVSTHTGAGDPHGDRAFAVQRGNHTGTQLAATVSDFATAVAATALLKANNLSDVANPATARTNLGLGSWALLTSPPVTTLGADLTTASTALGDVTGLGITLGIGTYEVEWNMIWQGSVGGGAAVGLGPNMQLVAAGGLATSGTLRYRFDIQTSASTRSRYYKTAFSAAQAPGSGAQTATNDYELAIFARITTTTGGTLTPQYAVAAALGAGTLTIKAGSYAKVQLF